MGFLDDRIAALTANTGVFGSLTWIDPTGQWWIAPLGSPTPNPDRPVPAAWVPVKILDRETLDRGYR